MIDWTIPLLFIAVLLFSLATTYVAVRFTAAVLVRLRLPGALGADRSAFARAVAATSACTLGLLVTGGAVVMSVARICEHVLGLPVWGSALVFICAMALCSFVGARIERGVRRWTGVQREANLFSDLSGAYTAFHRGRALKGATPAATAGK